MHGAIAAAAESSDWQVSAKHFALAGMPEDGYRVLSSAASEALGTGAWGAAVEVVELMPGTPPPVAVKVIQARALVSDGRADDAFELLSNVDRRTLSPEERGLVGLTCAAIHHMNGDGARVSEEVEAIAADDHVPSPLHEVAVSWRQILDASAGGCITDAVHMLRRLAVDQRRAGLHYFAGVTLHNLAYAEFAIGEISTSSGPSPRLTGHILNGPTMARALRHQRERLLLSRPQRWGTLKRGCEHRPLSPVNQEPRQTRLQMQPISTPCVAETAKPTRCWPGSNDETLRGLASLGRAPRGSTRRLRCNCARATCRRLKRP